MRSGADRGRGGASERGFTLLEVLIAFAITAFTLAVLLQGSIAGLRAAAAARDYEAALVRARSRLAALDGGGLVAGEPSGDDGGGFRWRTTITELAEARDRRSEAAAAAGAAVDRAALYAVTVVVSWGDKTHERNVRLESERLRMTPAGHAAP